jgi:tRNA dimethylallyltransferase
LQESSESFPLVVICGPTATGKTKVSIDLAKRFSAQVVNFDSLCFYSELLIGTARPSQAEMGDIPHHLFGFQSISKPLNAKSFCDLAIPIIQEIHAQGDLPILVGGSGFYLQALLNGMYESTTSPKEIIQKSDELYHEQGIDAFVDILQKKDPESVRQLHLNDHYRIRRAVEYFWTTGEPISISREKMPRSNTLSRASKLNWNVRIIYLDLPKPLHWEIIRQRADAMVENGLIQEVEALLSHGFTGDEKPLRSIGYKETINYLKGGFHGIEEYKERLFINTRRLAKAQRTWFGKVDKFSFNPLEDDLKIENNIRSFIEN